MAHSAHFIKSMQAEIARKIKRREDRAAKRDALEKEIEIIGNEIADIETILGREDQ